MPPPPGRGAGRGRGRGAQSSNTEDAGNTRYERISLLSQELQGCATGGDGADSTAFSEDEEYKDIKEERHQEESDEDEGSVEEDGESALGLSSEDEERRSEKKKKPKGKKRAREKSNECNRDMFTATAFGAAFDHGKDVMSDNESMASQTSSKRRFDAHKKAFPVRGITCVGCTLANRIEPVERFVRDNVGRQSEQALWKFAALTWKREVVEPARREGVTVVDWRWRDIAKHFKMHTTMAVVGRTSMVNSLTAMRLQIEGSLVRNDNGERSLDKQNAELALKILAAESRERQLLQADTMAGRGRKTGGSQKPAGGDE